MTDAELIALAGQRALDYDKLSGCSQAVLGALQETLGLGDGSSFKAATVLSGGVARRGETCGALLGALMALGIACGREQMSDTAAYSRAMALAQPVVDAFKAELGTRLEFGPSLETTLCRDIQRRLFKRSFDLSREDERQAFLDAGGHDDNKCPLVCRVAAEVTARAIVDARQQT